MRRQFTRLALTAILTLAHQAARADVVLYGEVERLLTRADGMVFVKLNQPAPAPGQASCSTSITWHGALQLSGTGPTAMLANLLTAKATHEIVALHLFGGCSVEPTVETIYIVDQQ